MTQITQEEAMAGIISVQDKPSIKIGDVNYTITLLNTSRAYATGQEIIKLMAPMTGAAFDGMKNDEMMFEESHTFQAVAIHLRNQLGEIDTLALITEMLEKATADGVVFDFDSHFPGRLDHLMSLVEFALEANYSSLFMGTSLREKLQKFMKQFQARTVAATEEEGQSEE